jgi:SAM-dependent methyltransferase
MKRARSGNPSIFIIYLLLATILLSMPGPAAAGTVAPGLQDGKFVFRGGDGAVLDVPYVPTEDFVVDEMFKLVDLRAGDVLYDLGCGDGRIVVGAAKRAGVRGVGIDIDPTRIRESKEKAVSAGVARRTTFLRQDLFQSDIGEATVVTLFLLHEINMKLRPKLFTELRPGTRVVSHNFDMGDWTPDKSSFLGLWEDGFHTLYSWVIPANVSGSWTGRFRGESITLVINQKLQRITGGLMVNKKIVLPISESEISGEQIRFAAKSERQKRSFIFEGKATGNVLEGFLGDNGEKGEPWKAIRDAGTISWIE